MNRTFWLVMACVFGACLGSFLNVVIYRVPRRTFLSGGSRSHCPGCDAPIAWFDNLPLLSWLVLLRGRARCCGARISARYPLVEALTALLIGWVFCTSEVGQLLPQLPTGPQWAVLAFHVYFVAVLVACTFIDIDHRILPDVLTKPTMVIGVVGSALVPQLAAGSFVANPDWMDGAAYSLVGLLAGLVLTYLIRDLAGRVFRTDEAMGLGDVKFMGAIGAFLGWDGAVLSFFLGALLGSVYGGVHQIVTKEARIFFGPFLAAGALIGLRYKAPIVHFIFVEWPAWQQRVAPSPWVLGAVAVAVAALLVMVVRRGRNRS